MNKTNKAIKIENKKAYHDYFVDDTLECGIELKGNEVKSIRNGSCNIKESWCQVQNGQLFIRGMFISKYETANTFYAIDEVRERRLLAHKKQITDLYEKSMKDGYTLVPLKVYDSGKNIKILIGVCKGKHTYDKRNTLKERQVKRDIERSLK